MYKAAAAPPSPALPPELTYIWDWFGRLSKKRQNGMGVCPLSSPEILAWQSRFQLQMTPFEHAVIDRLDNLFVHHQNEKEN